MNGRGGRRTIAYLGVLANLQLVDPTVANTALVQAASDRHSAAWAQPAPAGRPGAAPANVQGTAEKCSTPWLL